MPGASGSERPRPERSTDVQRALLQRALQRTETTIHGVVAALLVVAAALTLIGTVVDLVEGAASRPIGDVGVFLLDRVLLLFIITELLYTLRLVDFGGRVLVEPFLFIGLIAVVRRILVVTAETDVRQRGADLNDLLIQIAALGGLALVLAVAIYLLRRSQGPQR
jgi:uncharacterized membrane protein (DUF373 family)